MKSNAPKTQSSGLSSHSSKPFFNKSGEGAFFSKTEEKAEPFFIPSNVQTKLTVGEPGDKFEQEADQVADQVVQRLEQPKTIDTNQESPGISLKPLSVSLIQSKDEVGEAEEAEESDTSVEEHLQKKPIFESEANNPKENLQRQTLSNTPPPEYEEEKEKDEEEKEVETQVIKTVSDGEPEETVQAKSEGSEVNSTASIESRLNSSKGSGESLPKAAGNDMESAFGADFSTVRIHTNSDAVQMNKQLGARAFTHGSDVYFNQGEYDTGSGEGKKLLAHELTHSLQQGAAVQKKPNTIQTQQNLILQRAEGREGFDLNGVWFDAPLRDEFVIYSSLGLSHEASEYFTLNPDSLTEVRRQVTAILNPNAGPIHETMHFLEGPRVKSLVKTDLNHWPANQRMNNLSRLILARETTLHQQKLLYDTEQWLEANTLITNPVLYWPKVVKQVRSLGPPSPAETLVEASDYDRFEMFLTMLENEFYLLGHLDGHAQIDAKTLQQHLISYFQQARPASNLSKDTRRLHSEKFLDHYLQEISDLQFVPADFDLQFYYPDTSQAALNQERAILVQDFVNDLGPDYMSLYILNRWVTSGMGPDEYLAQLNMDSYKADMVNYMANSFFHKVKDDPFYRALMISEIDEKTTYQILADMYHSGQRGQSILAHNINSLYSEPPENLDETTRAIGNDPGTYAYAVKVGAEASFGFFDRVQQTGKVAKAAVMWASEIASKLDLAALVGLKFLMVIATRMENLKGLFEKQKQKAREDISKIVEVHYEQIAEQINNWVKYAENYMEQEFLPTLKQVALDRIEANRKALQHAYDNWETESEQVAARLRISALLLQELADKLASKEIEAAELEGQTLTVEDIEELQTTIKLLNKEAEKRENPEAAKKAKEKIKEALDGFEEVKEGILDGDYNPLDYSGAVYREAMDRLGIGHLTRRFVRVGQVLTGPVLKRVAGYVPAHANRNPFLYFAVTWWEWRENSERRVKRFLIFAGVGLLTLGAILAPFAAGVLISGAAATIIASIDIAVGIGLGIKGVLDAKELLRMARLDTDGSVYGVSPEAAEKALTHAWIGLALGFLAVGVGALYAGMMIRANRATKITPSMVRLNELVNTSPKLAHKLLKIVREAGKLENFLELVDDAVLLNRLLERTQDLRNLEFMLMVTDALQLERMLAKVENAGQLARLFEQTADIAKLERVLDTVTDVGALERVLYKANNIAEVERVLGHLADIAQLERLLDKADNILQLERILDTVDNAAQLERLLGKTTHVRGLEILLSHVDDAAQLERLLTKASSGYELERVLAMVGDAAQLERVLQKTTDVAELERVLGRIKDATKLEQLLAHTDDLLQVERLLRSLDDIPQLDRLLKIFPGTELENIFSKLSNSKQLIMMIDHTGVENTAKLITRWMSKQKFTKMNQFMERLSGGVGKELIEKSAIGKKSVIIDSQTAIALTKLEQGVPFSSLQNGEKLMVNYVRSLPPGTELHVANVTVGEAGSGIIHVKGLPISVARDSADYKAVIAELERLRVGGGEGIADRAIVADAFFAKTKLGVTPKFAVADKNIYNKLAPEAGINVRNLGGEKLIDLHPGGFEVTIAGKKLHVIPIQ